MCVLDDGTDDTVVAFIYSLSLSVDEYVEFSIVNGLTVVSSGIETGIVSLSGSSEDDDAVWVVVCDIGVVVGVSECN